MQGDKLNFTFAASKYVPSNGFIVNATALQRYPGMPRLALWCGVSDGDRRNDSAPLPSRASAIKPPGRSQASPFRSDLTASSITQVETPALACLAGWSAVWTKSECHSSCIGSWLDRCHAR